MSNRNLYFDFLRGIANIMIAAIHTSIINQHSVAVRQVIIVWIGSISFGIYLMHFFCAECHCGTVAHHRLGIASLTHIAAHRTANSHTAKGFAQKVA